MMPSTGKASLVRYLPDGSFCFAPNYGVSRDTTLPSTRALLSTQVVVADKKLPKEDTPKRKLNFFSTINKALHIALESDPRSYIFGEDVNFGGVFRCRTNTASTFGKHRVFNTPLCEHGIIGFSIGLAAMDNRAIAEIQFADYTYPAFDQIVNKAAKIWYKIGNQFDCGVHEQERFLYCSHSEALNPLTYVRINNNF